MITLSVIIPAYNEEKRIKPTLKEIEAYLSTKDYSAEIIVVSDGSTDKTDLIVQDFVATSQIPAQHVRLNENKGKGMAVKTGMLKATGEWRLFMDADNSTTINQIETFWPETNRYDLILGSRAIVGADIQKSQSWYRQIIGKTGNLLIRILLLPGIHDTQCGFKLFNKKCVEKVFTKQTMSGWSFDFEILALARLYNFKLKELPVKWENSEATTLNPIIAACKTLNDLIKVRITIRKQKRLLNKKSN
ncbi:MAG: dolichyl-phosphate beta-glucosyltransferase [bacterium]